MPAGHGSQVMTWLTGQILLSHPSLQGCAKCISMLSLHFSGPKDRHRL